MKPAEENRKAAVLPAELAPFTVELAGNRRAVADGFTALLSCSESCICLRAGRYTLRFSGHGLHIAALTPAAAVIEGFLTGVEYGG